MIEKFLVLILFLSQVYTVPLTALTINCDDGHTANEVEACLEPFKDYYKQGVDVFTQVNDSTADQICRIYEMSRSCIVMYMHFCPDVKKRHSADVKKFEYACTADRTGDWPFSPTITSIDEEDEEAQQKNAEFYSDMIKVTVAALVTLLLVLACAAAELATKLKVRSRIKRATAAANLETLVKKSPEEKETTA